MIKLDEIRYDKLIALAKERLGLELREAEKKVLRDSAGSIDPEEPVPGVERPEVRADFIRWLATDPEAVSNIDPKGLRVWGATISEKLDLEECRISPTLYLRGCTIKGDVNLLAVEIKGWYLTDSRVTGSVWADGILSHGPVNFSNTRFFKEVRILGATMESELNCAGSRFYCREDALSLDDLKISNNIFFTDCFKVRGSVRLPGAHIEGIIVCEKSVFTTRANALMLDRANVQGGVRFRKGTAIRGTVRIPGAELHGDLEFWNVRAGDIYCKNLQLNADFILIQVRRPGTALLKLSGARIRALRDDRSSWPSPANLILGGLVYEDIIPHKAPTAEELEKVAMPEELELTVEERVSWLKLQEPRECLNPQPWMQLRSLFQARGDSDGAKHVVYEYRCLRAHASSFLLRRWKIAVAWLEEDLRRVLWLIGCTFLIFTPIFWIAGANGALAPTEKDAYEAFTSGRPMPSAYPTLNPPIYTLENALPLAKIGQDDKWAPDKRFPSRIFLTNYWFLMVARWVLQFLGWFQAGILGAAVIDRFKTN